MRYPGGKNHTGTFQKIINLMPPHRVYIEPFLGSGAILRLKKPAAVSIGVDLVAPKPALLQVCKFVRGDALDFLAAYKWQGDELVYCDPPYLLGTRVKQKMYECEMTDADHRRLLSIINKIPAKVMISGYRCPLYDKALSGWTCETFPVMTRAHTWRTEALWFNYPLPEKLHDASFTGNDYRERWRIEKKRRNLVAKFQRMPPLERAALFSALVDVMGLPA